MAENPSGLELVKLNTIGGLGIGMIAGLVVGGKNMEALTHYPLTLAIPPEHLAAEIHWAVDQVILSLNTNPDDIARVLNAKVGGVLGTINGTVAGFVLGVVNACNARIKQSLTKTV